MWLLRLIDPLRECLEQWLKTLAHRCDSAQHWEQRDLTSFQRGVRPRQGMRNVKAFGLLSGNPGITSSPEFDVWKWQGQIMAFLDIWGFKTFSLLCTFSWEATGMSSPKQGIKPGKRKRYGTKNGNPLEQRGEGWGQKGSGALGIEDGLHASPERLRRWQESLSPAFSATCPEEGRSPLSTSRWL